MKKSVIILCVLVLSSNAWAKKSRKVKARERRDEIIEIVPETKQNPSLLITPFAGVTSFLQTVEGQSQGRSDIKSTIGFSVGALADIGSNSLSLQTGFAFLQLGTAVRDSLGVTTTTTLNYLAVPIYGKYTFFRGTSASIYAKAGAIPAYFISGQASFNRAQFSDYDISSDTMNSFDVLASGGIGGTYNVSTKLSAVIDLTMSRGFIDTNKADALKTYNQGLLLLGGVRFGI